MTTIVALNGVIAADSRISIERPGSKRITVDSRQLKLFRVDTLYVQIKGKRIAVTWLGGAGLATEINLFSHAISNLTIPMEIRHFLKRFDHTPSRFNASYLGLLETGESIRIDSYYSAEKLNHYKVNVGSKSTVGFIGSGANTLNVFGQLGLEGYSAVDYVNIATLFDKGSGGLIVQATASDRTLQPAVEWSPEQRSDLVQRFTQYVQSNGAIASKQIPAAVWDSKDFEIYPIENGDSSDEKLLLPTAAIPYLKGIPVTDKSKWITAERYFYVGKLRIEQLSPWLYQLVGVIDE